MDDDQEVAVTQQLNLNGTDNDLGSWEEVFAMSTHNLSLDERSGSSSQQDQNDGNRIRRCCEFIKKHVRDADPEFIQSLLQSEIDNPTGLELVMREMFNIPNALELIQELKKGHMKAGDKRGMVDSSSHPGGAKKKRKDTEIFLRQLKEMFPDADGLFLITECQQLESCEDFSRFINTVMLSGIYPKKGAADYSEKAKPAEVVITPDPAVAGTSEEEAAVLVLTEKNEKQKRRSKEHEKTVEETEVIDLTDESSLDTETYETPPLSEFQESFCWNTIKNPPAQEVVLSDKQQQKDDFGKRPKSSFGRGQAADIAIPGPSGEGARRKPKRSLSEKTFRDTREKSLAEILEEKRNPRRRHSSAGSGSSAEAAEAPGATSLPKDAIPEVVAEDEGEAGEEWLAEQTANLMRIFPNTDPSYLREQLSRMNGSSEAVNEFVVAKLERNDMPLKVEYEKRLEMEELQNRYTKNFSIEDFLKAVPDPWMYFKENNRNCAKYKSHSLSYLKSAFRKHYVRDIIDTLTVNKFNLYLSYKDLMRGRKKVRSKERSIFECNNNRPTTIDIQFLQEVAFIENEDKIQEYLKAENLKKQLKFEEAKRTGSLLECQCCFDSEVMVEDMFYCPSDHAFCRTCIIRSVEVEIGYGRHRFVCLTNCEEKFSLPCLQNVLSPDLFSKVIKAIQMEEIRAAEIEDLVQCPFCTYATIMPPEVKVLTCLNPECLKESCRLCKELNHIPLRCDEVEKSEEVKMRTYIENKMTEALVRTCYNCGKKFVKEDGCNKMTCTCGAKMCYVCRKPVTDYAHFNGQGGTEYEKCPLYSTNDELHVEVVRRIGEQAKAKILQENPHKKLLHDPTALPPKRTNQTPMPGVNNGAALDFAVKAVMGTLEPQDEHVTSHNGDGREGIPPRNYRLRHEDDSDDDFGCDCDACYNYDYDSDSSYPNDFLDPYNHYFFDDLDDSEDDY